MMPRFPDELAVAISEDGWELVLTPEYATCWLYYIGAANPFNLLTDINDDQPEGGWGLASVRGYSLRIMNVDDHTVQHS